MALLTAGVAAQPAPLDLHEDKRRLLEKERRELSADIGDAAWMKDQGRATLARLSVERGWKACAENEAAALAAMSEKPARLLAEEALTVCGEWGTLLRLALDKGAYPYLNGYMSREDMITLAELDARDGALARISLWRAGSSGSAAEKRDENREEDEVAGRQPILPPPSSSPPRELPPPAETPAAEAGEAQTIVVTATRLGGCRVRLADRTLTERELEANAKQWAADQTPLRVVRPAGADYHCLARIVWSLNKYGVTLFHFVEPSQAR